MNYLRSELYALVRTKSLLFVVAMWFVGFMFMTQLFLNAPVENNPRQSYFTGMIIVGSISGYFLTLFISNLLTGRKLNTLKQTISFGISRNTIYFVKFIVTVVVCLLIISMLMIAGFLYGNMYLSGSNQQQGIKIINSLPLLISSIALCNWFNFSKINPIVTTITVLGIYLMSSDIVSFFDGAIFKKEVFTNFFPSALILKAVNSTHFEPSAFFIGLGLTLLFLLVGLKNFHRRDIA